MVFHKKPYTTSAITWTLRRGFTHRHGRMRSLLSRKIEVVWKESADWAAKTFTGTASWVCKDKKVGKEGPRVSYLPSSRKSRGHSVSSSFVSHNQAFGCIVFPSSNCSEVHSVNITRLHQEAHTTPDRKLEEIRCVFSEKLEWMQFYTLFARFCSERRAELIVFYAVWDKKKPRIEF